VRPIDAGGTASATAGSGEENSTACTSDTDKNRAAALATAFDNERDIP